MPVPTRHLQYGSFVFPGEFHVADDGHRWTVPQAKLPRTDGARVLVPTLNAKRVQVRGGFIRGPFTPNLILRDELDTLRAALYDQPARLYLHDDRYYRCVMVEDFRNPYDATHYERMAVGIEIDFICRDPFQYALTTITDTWTSPVNGGTRTITVAGGNVFVRPTYTFTIGGSGAVTIGFVLTNTTTGEIITLSGAVTGGQALVIDTLLETVKIGTTDKMSLFDGQFVRLELGANAFTLAISSGSITSIVTTYAWRWL